MLSPRKCNHLATIFVDDNNLIRLPYTYILNGFIQFLCNLTQSSSTNESLDHEPSIRTSAEPSEIVNWAATWQNQHSDCAPSKDSDLPPGLISLCCPHEESLRSLATLSPYLGSLVDAQAGLSLRWAHTHFVGFVVSWFLFSWSDLMQQIKSGITFPWSQKRTSGYPSWSQAGSWYALKVMWSTWGMIKKYMDCFFCNFSILFF